MDFEKKLKIRLCTSVTYLVAGIALCVAYFCKINEKQFVLTFGAVLIAMGIVRICGYLRITKDSESVRRQRIAESDERNISIMKKAKSTAFGIYVLAAAVIVIVLEFSGRTDLANIIAMNLSTLVFLYWLCYWIYQKRL